ncbi:Protein of unknown function [Clostridium cavendishii DSM 21758]|uniref:DUF3793 family protein n=1 Tax=Clostridium cavendishii DSM 21758 TaxID=1121302 RepID=A0A1M6VBE8_9CLOT|nr:DUF3793 family protein [Clostridium cavendishii]SHK78778.1 Protein of unknown function [Clostridium cavendishii DSM 21758]
MIRFFDKLNDLNDTEYMKRLVTYLIAPVLTGIKPSSTITLNDEKRKLCSRFLEYGDEFIKSLDLNYKIMKTSPKGIVILVYNKSQLEKYIYINKNKQFLCKLGYGQDFSLEKCLSCLKTKFEALEFPHEAGVFLGFPLEDVIEFMNNNKNFLCSGYWRVYHNENSARELFRLYDKSKELVANCILEDLSLLDIKNTLYNIYVNETLVNIAI